MALQPVRIGVLFVLFALLSAPLALAGPAYRTIVTSNPQHDNAERSSGFSVRIILDEEKCKKQYGADWSAQCSAPPAGEPGRRVEGVQMSPAVPGVWRWEYGSAMRFFPENRLAPDTRYTISLEKVSLPGRFDFVKRTVTYTTQPQGAKIGKETLWIDPSPKGAHAISVPLSFIWPATPADVEKLISLTPTDAKSGLTLGAPRFVWNESRDEMVVSAPVTALAEDNAAARLTVQNMPPFEEKDGKRIVQKNKKDKETKTQGTFSVTGKSQLLKVSSIVVQPRYDADLDKKYQLEVKTTLRVLPSEVLRYLEVIQLPRTLSPGAGQDCDWSKMPAVSAKDIEKGEKLTPQLLQPADEPADRILLQIPAQAGRGLLTAMRAGLPSTSGLTLKKLNRFILTVPPLEAELRFLQPGNVLALSGDKKLDIYATGLTSIAWRAERVREPFLALLAQETGFTPAEQEENEDEDEYGGQRRVVNFSGMSDALEGRMDVQKGGSKNMPGGASFPVLDMAPLLQGGQNSWHGLVRLTLTGFDGEKQVAETSRLVLVTDIGMTIKTAADGSCAVFAQRLGTGKALSGAQVRLLGANGLPVLTATTNDQGRADLPPTQGLVREKRPVALVVSASASGGQDMAWLSLSDAARRVDYSDFAVAGRHSAADGLSASVFSQRGLYLPGETLRFGCVARRFDWQPLPADLPLEAVLTSPTGTEVMRTPFKLAQDGLNTFDWKTPDDAAVGTYRLDIRLAAPSAGSGRTPVLGSAEVRVEEFQPDTLALNASFEPKAPKGWIRTDQAAGPAIAQARLDNLYGEPASGHRVEATFLASPGKLRFPGFEDYTFHDATPYGGETQSIEMPAAFTNEKGVARFSLPLGKLQPGTIRGVFQVQGFELEGGRAVGRQMEALFSPLDVALGYKPEDAANNLDYIPQGAKASLRLLAVNNDLAPVSLQNADIVLSARRYVNSLVTDARGEYRYDATPVDTEISRQSAAIGPEGYSWTLPTGEAGDFLVTVRKSDGTPLAIIPYSVAGNRLAEPESLSADSLVKGNLRLKLDKERYEAGETIKMRLSTPYAGTGLITIERENVLAHAWFTAEAGSSVQEIKIPANFEGRGYVNVSFSRSLQSDTVYMKPYAYAVAPFTAGVARRDMGLKIEAPARVLPGEKVTLRLTARQAGRAQVFAVDEGVLQLTAFRTPDPLHDLLADRALDVDTRHAFDLLMPDHARLRGRIPGFGGDMGGAGGRFLNPFKRRGEPPFAFWSEIVSADTSGTEITFTVPQYTSGRIRIMAVGSAVSSDASAAGSAQAFSEVRGTLLLKPLLPLAVAPGDTFDGALVVANTVENSGSGASVQVRMECDPGLAFVNSKKEQTITVDENGEAVVRFTLKAREHLGEASVRFTASLEGASGKGTARSQSLSVRPPAPRVRTETETPLTASTDIPVRRDIYTYEAVGRAAVSSVPMLGLRSVFSKLDAYPYGCTEQLISRALPYAALLASPALREQVLRTPGRSPEEAEKLAGQTIANAIAAIRRNFTAWEGVSPWPGREGSDFVTAYAADLLLTLRENGAAVPEGLTRNVLDTLENIVGRSPADLYDGRVKLYGAWLLLRDGRIMTQQVERLEQWYKDNTTGWEKDIVAVLMADCYALLRLARTAEKRFPSDFNPGTGDAIFSVGMARALHATIIQRDFPQRAKEIQAQDLLQRAFDTRASTVDLGFTARALTVMALGEGSVPTGIKLTCEEYAQDFTPATAPAELVGSLLQLDAPGCLRFRAELPATGKQQWQAHVTAEGFERAPLGEATNGMELQRRYLNSRGEPVTSARLGEVLTVELTARAASADKIDNVVLVDLLPGGFEPILEKDAPSDMDGLIRYERREDRGIFFVELAQEKRVFTYRVRAATKGRFILPTASVEAMYTPEVNGRVGGGHMDVQ